jgi:type IV pilus assembly protein PilB
MDLLSELEKRKKLSKKTIEELKIEYTSRGGFIEDLILEKGLLSEEELFKIKSEIAGIPLKTNLPEEIPSEISKLFSKETIQYYRFLPFSIDKKEKILEVGMVFPEDIQAMEIIKFLARQEKLNLKIYLITPSTFKKYFQQFVQPKEEFESALEKLKTQSGKTSSLVQNVEFERRAAEEAPIVKMVNVIIKEGVDGNASDIHIEPLSDKVRVRYRQDGILHTSLTFPLEALSPIIARIKILSNLKIDETRIPQDGRFSMVIGEKRIDFRVSTFPTIFGEKVAIRILDPTQGLKPLEALGLSKMHFEILKEAILKPYGMILVTGPTGSGKTTTLYSILTKLNQENINIVTLEDPVEYFIEGINQSQVKPEIGWNFAQGLRQILRQDPDVIMVGEIRDEETIELAIHAGLTGHLVLSTLHTNNAVGVFPRMIDMKVENYLIPLTLRLAISQRLARKLCPYCKKKVKPSKTVEDYIKEKIKNLPESIQKEIPKEIEIYEPQGCKKCAFKGYSGRIGLFEVLKMTDNLAKLINKERILEEEILKEARKEGFITMEEDGILKVFQGLTSFEEVMRVAKEK